jgi:hypothetical protein
MRRRNLPVKFFSKRKDVDERLVEGMGNNDLPGWVLKGEFLQKRAAEIIDGLENGKKYFENRNQKREFIPLALKAYITEDALAKTHRKKVGQLFSAKQENNIIRMIDENNIIIKVDTLEELKKIEDNVKKYERNAHAISCIEDIEVFKPIISVSDEVDKALKVKLIQYNNYELDSTIAQTFELLCKNMNIDINKTFYTEELIVYKLGKVTLDNLEELKLFEALFSMEDMPTYISNEFDFNDGPISISVKVPDSERSYPIVGVLDTGISENKYLKDWILSEKSLIIPEEYRNTKHGTFVAGIISYGDQLFGEKYTGIDGCKVFDATVFSDKEAIDQDILISNIENTLRRYCDKIKIWNLSIGSRDEIDEDKFSDFGVALDALQDKYDVIICKSVGNSDAFINVAPKNKIAKSADSVRSIVVGSIAKEKGEFDIALKNHPSPFTRIGRGPGYIIKPDLVHYGGNAGINSDNKPCYTGVKSFAADGKIIEGVGTSYSTPMVSTILAGVQHELKEEFDPLLLKGLVIHSSKYPEDVDLPIGEKINQMGFGMPPNINEIIYNNPNEITLILRDRLIKGEFIEILDFPYPKSLSADGYYYGQVIVTVVYNPILDANQGGEYCQSDLKVAFGTYDDKCLRDTNLPYIKNPIGKENGQNILQQSCYSKKSLKSSDGEFSGKERLLIQYGDKYYPIKKYAIDLDEMTTTNKAKYLSDERNWYIKIEGLFRDAIEKKAQKDGFELYEDFCVIVTIRDSRNEENPVYNEVTALLDYYNFYHNNISLRQDIHVNIDENEDTKTELDKLIDDIMSKK